MTDADGPSTLARLLDVWRDTRDPALADLIDRISAHVARPGDVVFPSSRRHQSWRWKTKAAGHDILELPEVLMTWRGLGWSSVEHLAAWPDDPRIARALVAAITHETWAPRVAEMCSLLARLRDPRG